MASVLNFAKLCYGARAYNVTANEITPIPATIDPAAVDFIDTCRNIFAMMSNASGGHTIRDCKVSVWNSGVNLSANGVHVFYKDPDAPKFDIKAGDDASLTAFIELIERNRVVVELGDVSTDQYGEGWKRATWKKA